VPYKLLSMTGFDCGKCGERDDIKIQEAAVSTQPGDTSSLAVLSWELDGHRRAGRQLDRVIPRGETSEKPNPILQRGPPDLVVISHWGGYVKSTSSCLVSIACPSSILVQISNVGQIPSPIFGAAGIQRLLRQ